MSDFVIFGGEAILVGTSTQGPTGPTGAPGATGTSGATGPPGIGVVTNTVVALSTVVPTMSAQSTSVDGYAAHNDSGLSGYGAFNWNPTYTGPADALNVYTTASPSVGAWQRQIGPDFIVPVTWFGAKGDGVTDDTAAIQSCMNTCWRQGWGVYFPSLGTSVETTYLITKPLFPIGTGLNTAGSAPEIRMAKNARVTMATSVCAPALFAGLQLPAPTYGTESGLTYVDLTPPQGLANNNIYQLSMIPNAASVNGWGNGNVAQLAQSFTQPALLTSIDNILVSSTASYTVSPAAVYIHGGGFYFMTVVDGTHVNLQWIAQILSTDVLAGGTVANGAGISVNGFTSGGIYSSGGPSAGLTFECFVDPVSNFPNGDVLYLISSQGMLGTAYPLTCAFYVSLYNDQATAQTRLKFSLTTTSATTVLNSGTHTIATGSMTHVAATYDGISTMSLYIAGVRVATATVTGSIVQNWYEEVYMGARNTDSFPSAQYTPDLNSTIKLAGVGLYAIAKYAGASFTPPTTAPTAISRVASVCIDFAQQPTVTGPGGLNYGQGWVLATTPNLNLSTTGLTTWLPSRGMLIEAQTNYCQGPRMTNCTVQSSNGTGLLTNAALNGVLENCTIDAVACVSLLGFSYNWRIQNCYMQPNVGTYGWSWAVGVLDGSQFTNIDGGFYSSGLWGIASAGTAGIMIRNLYTETRVTGGILLGSSFTSVSPTATIRDVFFQSDQGTPTSNPQVTNSVYAYNVAGVLIEGGYAIGNLVAPSVVFDSCGVVEVVAFLVGAGSQGHSASPNLVSLFNQAVPVSVQANQAYVPFPISQASVSVTNGSASVTVANLIYQYSIYAGICVQFASQPSTTYRIASIVTGGSTQTWTLHAAYSGTTNAATFATDVGVSWMPESGTGQGPLLIGAQETFGSNTVNMIAAGGMTLLVNDFLWRTIQFVDLNSLLSGGVTITTPNVVGYQRTFLNGTGQTLTISAGAGTTVAIAAGAAGRMVLLSTGWMAD